MRMRDVTAAAITLVGSVVGGGLSTGTRTRPRLGFRPVWSPLRLDGSWLAGTKVPARSG